MHSEAHRISDCCRVEHSRVPYIGSLSPLDSELPMSRRFKRILIAIGVAPAILALPFGIWCELVLGRPNHMVPAYVIGSYPFGIPLAVSAVGLLHAFDILRFWHFTVAGLLAGCIRVLLNYERLPETTALVLLFISAIVGACVWLISEWEPPNPIG